MAAGKTYDYIIVCKQRDFRFVNQISLLMLALASIILLEEGLTPFNNASVFPLSLIALIIGWCVYTRLKEKNGKTAFYRIAFLFAAWGLLIATPSPIKWLSFLFIVAAALEKQVKFPREIAFDEEEVVINTFPRKSYAWSDISNVVLKDNLLTVDFKNNQLIQKELDATPSAKLEQDFNEFCRGMLLAEQNRKSH